MYFFVLNDDGKYIHVIVILNIDILVKLITEHGENNVIKCCCYALYFIT